MKNKFKYLSIIIIIMSISLILTNCSEKTKNKNYNILKTFVSEEMTSENGGIYTNYLDKENEGDLTRGHEILSESVGLQLLIAYNERDKESFNNLYNYINEFFLEGDKSIRWRIDENNANKTMVNASIDDLRIARAFLLAYEIWPEEKYEKLALDIGNGLLDHSIWQNYLLNQKHGEFDIETSYQDTYTMGLLGKYNETWLDIRRYSLSLVENAYLGDEFPFYHKIYQIKDNNYLKYDNINMTDSMITVLHLSEDNRVKSETINWLKDKLKQGYIYDEYRYGDWRPISGTESTAIYALVARTAKNINDNELFELAIDKMERFQVKDRNSQIYGSFGTDETLEVFSFDLLQSMVAYLEG